MFAYYLRLAFISIKNTPLLSLLITLTVAVGIAASMTTFSINRMMSKDPLPGLGERTFIVQLNNYGPERALGYDGDVERTDRNITVQDARNLLAAKQAPLQTAIGTYNDMLYGGNLAHNQALFTDMRSVSFDFFAMTSPPFLYGAPWSKVDDEQGTDVVIISKKLNGRLFNGENSVGKVVYLGDRPYTISGVFDDWPIMPKFYTSPLETYRAIRDVFIPFSNQVKHELQAKLELDFSCWKEPEDDSPTAFFNSECNWIFFWVQLDSAADKARYLSFINDYALSQRQFGRFQRNGFHKLLNIEEYLLDESVLSKDNQIGVWLAFLFLLLCLLNCMSLLTAKFHSKAAEVGLRRAVGASKQNLFAQFGCEILILGCFAALLGLLMTYLGLQITQTTYSYLSADIMHMDLVLIGTTVTVAILSTLVFGLLPIYRAIQIQPASQLKSL